MAAKKQTWDLESVVQEAKKYDKRGDFRKNSPGAYSWARTNGFLEQVCSHMASPKTKVKWNLESVTQEAKKYNKRIDFINKSASAYQWAYKNRHLEQVCSHMKKQLRKWSLEAVAQEAKKYDNRGDFRKNSPAAYSWAQRHGYLKQICSHMGPPKKGGAVGKWNLESVTQEAKKYNKRGDFSKKSATAYQWAYKNGHLEQVCSHMAPPQKGGSVGKWNLESVTQEAKKYDNRGDFSKNSPAAYQWSRRNGHLEQVCSHMKKRKA